MDLFISNTAVSLRVGDFTQLSTSWNQHCTAYPLIWNLPNKQTQTSHFSALFNMYQVSWEFLKL